VEASKLLTELEVVYEAGDRKTIQFTEHVIGKIHKIALVKWKLKHFQKAFSDTQKAILYGIIGIVTISLAWGVFVALKRYRKKIA